MFLAPAEFVRSPEALAARPALPEAEAYTRWLATHHYENFHVVSILLPKRLHQDFYNVYAFCRWADDLGDEIGDTQESLRLLAWWHESLSAMYAGRAAHPVFVALANTVNRHGIPEEPFSDLIRAFVQDQTVTRYANWDELHGYCRYSANPVGRLVLHLCGYTDDERRRLSDDTCTALQLANFWQDVAIDWGKDRVYLPLELLARHRSGTADIESGEASPAFRAALREAVDHAEALFHRGLPLVNLVDRRLAIDLDLFSRGGLRVLEKIRARDYDVLSARPAISKTERVGLLLRTLLRVGLRAA
ncbi:MAG: squalene synthase HpnC [Bryobacterales bacterium]|nr:squalene synthase HpnC [Bryobacterales bacterium]